MAAAEHEGLARHHHKKGRRQVGKARKVIEFTDRTGMTPDQVSRLDRLERQLADQQAMMRGLDGRVRKTEARQKVAEAKVDVTGDRLAAIEAALTKAGLIEEWGQGGGTSESDRHPLRPSGRYCKARRGKARRGEARSGRAWPGKAGKAGD